MKRRGFSLRGCSAAAIVGMLVGCASEPLVPSEPARVPGPPPPLAADRPGTMPAVMTRERSRWVAVSFADLPGWDQDTLRDALTPLLRGCEKPTPAWGAFCQRARTQAPQDEAGLRRWLSQQLVPYRIEALDGAVEGLATGYFEPLVDASRQPRGEFRVPLYGPPVDLAERNPYWTRQQIDTLSVAQAALRQRVIAYVADPLEALMLQVQGSGRLRVTEADGRVRLLRVAYAGHNNHPYKSVGRWLIEQGELKPGEASWPAIRDWARRNPKRVSELMWSNPRVVFFREELLPDPAVGPRGAAGVPLSPGRSIAVDPASVPYGTPIWLDTSEPLSSTPLRRLVVAQDTGSAIVGAVRADYFWGWGETAEQQAGRMKQPLRLWALWPKDAPQP